MPKSIIYKGATILLVLAFLLLVQVQPLNNTVKVLNLFNIVVVGAFFVFENGLLKDFLHKKAIFLVLILIISYIFSAKSIVAGLDNAVTSEPVDKGYVSDEKDFLKTFYIMRGGKNYYQSFALALINDARFTRIPIDLFSWRLPTTFYFWKFLAHDGEGIVNLFILLSSISLLATFFISKTFVPEKFAVFSPLALMPYFLNAVFGTSFLFIEWWSLFPFLFGLAFVLNKKTSIGVCLLILAFFTRELLIIPVLGIAIVLFFKSKKMTPLLIILFVFFVFMFMHKVFIEINFDHAISFSARKLHPFYRGFLLHILAFSTQFYTFVQFRIGTLFTILTSAGFLVTALLLKDKKDKNLLVIAIFSFLPLFLMSHFMSSSVDAFYSDYWAIIIMPLFIIFSPLIFNIVPFLKRVYK